MLTLLVDQYSDQWWTDRAGRPSASMFSEIATSKGERSKQWWSAVYRLAAELVMGHTEKAGYKSEDMLRGTEMEPEAREAYQFINDTPENPCVVTRVGCIFRDELKLYACSPDGIVNGNIGLEIKCPKSSTHQGYLYKGVLPTDYKPQVYGSLWICDELVAYDFFSYHPELRPFQIRVTRQDEGYKIYSEALAKYMPEFIRNVAEVAKA